MDSTPPRNSLFLGSRLFPRNNHPHRTPPITVAAAFVSHYSSRAAAFQAGGNHVQLLQCGIGQFGRIFEQLGVTVIAQPEDELAFQILALFAAQLSAALRPPLTKAAIANQLTGVEERAGFGAAMELLTP